MYCRKSDCKNRLGFSYFEFINKDINEIKLMEPLLFTDESKTIPVLILNKKANCWTHTYRGIDNKQ